MFRNAFQYILVFWYNSFALAILADVTRLERYSSSVMVNSGWFLSNSIIRLFGVKPLRAASKVFSVIPFASASCRSSEIHT